MSKSSVRMCMGLVVALAAWVGGPRAAWGTQVDPGEQVAVATDPVIDTTNSSLPEPSDLASLATTRALGMGFLSDLLVYNQMGDLGATAFLSSSLPVITANVFTGHARGTAPLAPPGVPETDRVGNGLNGTALFLRSFSPRDFADMGRVRDSAERPPELGWAPRWWLVRWDAEWIH